MQTLVRRGQMQTVMLLQLVVVVLVLGVGREVEGRSCHTGLCVPLHQCPGVMDRANEIQLNIPVDISTELEYILHSVT